MPRIGITGHMNLSAPTIPLIEAELHAKLAVYPPRDLVGFSCIAPGADSLFAQAVLDVGGRLEVVLPASDYRQRKVLPDHEVLFDRLIRRADQVYVMPHERSNREAYEAANEFILKSVDSMFAVWDGKAPADQGGTAAVVAGARKRGLPVEVIWPEGATRA